VLISFIFPFHRYGEGRFLNPPTISLVETASTVQYELVIDPRYPLVQCLGSLHIGEPCRNTRLNWPCITTHPLRLFFRLIHPFSSCGQISSEAPWRASALMCSPPSPALPPARLDPLRAPRLKPWGLSVLRPMSSLSLLVARPYHYNTELPLVTIKIKHPPKTACFPPASFFSFFFLRIFSLRYLFSLVSCPLLSVCCPLTARRHVDLVCTLLFPKCFSCTMVRLSCT